MLTKKVKEREAGSYGDEDRFHDENQEHNVASDGRDIVSPIGKLALVGVGARALFYPTLLYNVLRSKIQPEFRWWDKVDEFILLGAVPFPADIPRLKSLGVSGVVTLSESYETLVPSSLYHSHHMRHLEIPTRDYLFAPSFENICQAVNFIHENASYGRTTYVHCKAGRGRSTTIVLCYLVEHRHMTPESAYDHVRAIRPRILLTRSQWQAVKDYYSFKSKKITDSWPMMLREISTEEVTADDDASLVVTETDLDGYKQYASSSSNTRRRKKFAYLRLACSQFTRFLCLRPKLSRSV